MATSLNYESETVREGGAQDIAQQGRLYWKGKKGKQAAMRMGGLKLAKT